MENTLERVLVVSSSDSSREAAYSLTKVLNSFGYAVDLCNSGGEAKVKADKVLGSDSGVSGYAGLVVMDNGGSPRACIELAKKADAAEIPVCGHDEGCLILYLAGLLKGKFVCLGLPEEINSIAKPVGAPSVRSDNIVTGLGNCVEGFAILVVDALGGKLKKIVRGSVVEELPWRTALIIDDPGLWPSYWGAARSISELGGKIAIASWDDVDVDAGTAPCVLLDAASGTVRRLGLASMPKRVWMRQRGQDSAAVVSALEANGFRSVNSAKAHAMASKDAASILGGIVPSSGHGDEVVCSARRRKDGWEVTSVASRDVLGDKRLDVVKKTAEMACVAFQAALDDPNEVGELGVVIRVDGDSASVSKFDPIAPVPEPPPELGERQRWLIERELANEGLFLQHDGTIAIRSSGRLEKVRPEEAVARLQRSARDASKAEAAGEDKERLAVISKACRHRLRLLCALLSILDKSGGTRMAGSIRLADVYDSTSTGWYSNLDVPMFERVWEYNEDDDYLEDKDKAIRNLPRYNPEYDRNGFYFVWNEPRREPTSWERILDGDSVYPSRKILQRR
jgi:hypothetical protein